MIETCTRKRMVLAILVLFSLTIVTLIMEGMWSTHHSPADLNTDKDEEKKCSSSEVSVVKSCQPCTDFDLKTHVPYCDKTGHKEEVKCNDETFYRSCKMDPWIAERKYWIFQLFTCVLGFLSYGVVQYRQDKLDKLLMDKVNRQIAA